MGNLREMFFLHSKMSRKIKKDFDFFYFGLKSVEGGEHFEMMVKISKHFEAGFGITILNHRQMIVGCFKG
jgi:hypothetical protein